MKQLLRSVLLLSVPVYIYGQAKPADKSLPTTAGASTEQTLKQIERDWGNAEIKKDYATVDRILADDWMGIDYDGKVVAKTKAMEDMKSGTSTLTAEELGPMTVRVFGTTAVVTGSDTEKSTDRGKNSSGKYAWTDVFVLRNGRWQAIASQSTRAQ
jgi:ketosteroid isomerase-like protein